ncbi:MAG: SDR family oxidoreductase [Ignavibacterium sp.]|nr:MAG: SDR family oxidoreductase [Ignavibacterium sp.]
MNRKILITGGSGLLGQYLNIECSSKNKILTCYNNHIGNCNMFQNQKIDITDFNEMRVLFSSFEPEIVIHTAAITNTNPLPDQNSKDVYRINVHATKNIAELCETTKAKLIYISTDLVYAGYRGSMLKEDAKLIPVSLYAETKLMSEQKIKETFDNYLILRTALLYGIGLSHSTCHFNKMNDELKNENEVTLFADQFRTPISLKESAKIILQLSQLDIIDEIINVGGIERVSRYELGQILCSVAGYDKSLLTKNSLYDVPHLPKVEDVSLNTDKLQSVGIKLKTIEENILEIIHEN